MDGGAGQGRVTPAQGEGELVRVELVQLPLSLHARAREHSEGLRREFFLLSQQLTEPAAAPAAARDGVPARLLALIAALRGRYAGFTVEQEEAIDAGIAAGDPSIDLTFEVPAAAVHGIQELAVMLDDADEFCRQGTYLLTLATPPELVAYRHWYLEQFREQLAGQAPTSWPEHLHSLSGACGP